MQPPSPYPARMRSRGLALASALLVLACVAVLPPSVVLAERSGKGDDKSSEDEVDYVALGARLLKDGHYDRAELTLRQVDEKKEGVDLPRLYSLRGLLFLKKQVYNEARDNLNKAFKAGAKDPVLYLYLAQAEFGSKDYKATLAALDKAGATAADVAGAQLMRAQCQWELGQHDKALAVLSAGERRFADDAEFPRRRFFYLVDLKLFQEALDLGQRFVSRKAATEDDFVAVGEALREAHQYDKAEQILEAARLRFPDSVKLTLQLAHTYLAADDLFTAATLFEQATYRDGSHALEAAELYRRAKRPESALMMNARALDQAAKMKQRMAILLQMERYEMVAAMAPEVSRLGLLDQDDVRYGLAYAYFKTGAFDAAERQLKLLHGSEYFASGNELRKMMQSCRNSGWQCL